MVKKEQKKEQEVVKESPVEDIIETPEPIVEETVEVIPAPIAEEEVSAKDIKEIKKKINKRSESEFNIEKWTPKTELGKKVKSGEITNIDEIFDKGMKILEPEIVEVLLPNSDIDLLLIGQSKGKFGGGQRRVFKQTQKKTKEGNKPSFSTYAVFGNKNGYIGIGFGKSRETVPAREKAFRKAKLNLIRVRRGSGSWESGKGNPDSIPFKVTGKCGSVKVTLMPAPQGTGLCIEKECAKMLQLAGIKDIWSKTKGKTTTKINHVQACFDALKELMNTKVRDEDINKLNIATGKVVE